MRPLVLLLFSLGSLIGVCRGTEAPTWAELNALFGQPITSTVVSELVARQELKKIAKGSSGDFSPGNHSYSVMFGGNIVETIVLQIGPWPANAGEPHWTCFSGPLPFGLSAADDRSHVVAKLGEPTHPKGDHWLFQGYRLMLSFEEKSGRLREAYIWKEVANSSGSQAGPTAKDRGEP